MTRLLSQSEISALLECERRHSFGYTGHLTHGHTLKRKNPAITLRRGRAWGRAVAEWHATGDLGLAVAALQLALDEDAAEQKAAGVYVEAEHAELLGHLLGILSHYTETAERIPLTDPELELRVPLPSRTGKRASNRYAFQGFVDGLTREFRTPGLWIVEFKLRDRLSSLEQVAWSRQVRWYAWAAERQLGERIQGVLVDERLNAVPKPARVLKNGQPSHAKDQMTTPDQYLAACAEAGVAPEPETRAALAARDWQKRHPVFLRRAEIEEAGAELVSAGQAIAEMDSGTRFPIANRGQFTCPRCPYRGICDDPNGDLTAVEFDLTEPKRLRPQKDEDEVSAPSLPVAA